MMIYINITNFVLISELEKDHSMLETHCVQNVAIFFKTPLKSQLHCSGFLMSVLF